MKFPVKVFELQNFPNKEVPVSVRHLGVSDVDHIVIDIKVKLKPKKIDTIVGYYLFIMD